EGFQVAIMVPFVYQMVKSFNVSNDEKELGFYVGLITSVYSLAQVISSIPIGWLSDKFGRRPLMLVGLAGNAISLVFFGVSKTLSFALFTRALSGLLNGNHGISKSMVGEITDKSNQSTAFAFRGVILTLGTISGPALGGLFSDPANQYPDSIFDNEFFKNYPFALPCFIASLVNVLGFLFGYFKLNETFKKEIQLKKSDITNSKAYGTFSESEYVSSLDSDSNVVAKKSEKIPLSAFVPVVSFFILAFHEVIFLQAVPLLASSPLENGGLGLSSRNLGSILCFNGWISLF
ncbi:hypothetical protein HK096_009109, partial [Nowakowskiella sp. JEL0078]